MAAIFEASHTSDATLDKLRSVAVDTSNACDAGIYLAGLQLLGVDAAHAATAIFGLISLTPQRDGAYATARHIDLTGSDIRHVEAANT